VDVTPVMKKKNGVEMGGGKNRRLWQAWGKISTAGRAGGTNSSREGEKRGQEGREDAAGLNEYYDCTSFSRKGEKGSTRREGRIPGAPQKPKPVGIDKYLGKREKGKSRRPVYVRLEG